MNLRLLGLRMGLLGGLLLSSAAWAQPEGDAPPGYLPPPPLPPPPPPAAYDPYPPVAYAPYPEYVRQPVLFRWGLDGAIGYFSPAQAVDFAFDVRFGAQLSRLIGVYADLGGAAGVGLSGTGGPNSGSLSVSALGFWHIAPMVEFDFNKFFIAVGPLIAGGSWAQGTEGFDASGNTYSSSIVAGGVMPGADVRIGLTFGDRAPWGRLQGFTLALDLKVMVGHVYAADGNAPNQPVVGQAVFAFTPTLTLGFDAR